MKNSFDKIKQLAFIVCFIFATLTTHSNVVVGYGGVSIHIILKLLLILSFVGVTTFINIDNEKLINKYPPIIVNIVLSLLIFDYYFTNLSGTMLLYKIWWLAAIFVAESAIFIIATLCNINYYKKFYIRFWKGFTPTFVFAFAFCFVRMPNCVNRTINLIPFKRNLPLLINFIKNPTGTFENPLLFFGNLLFFIPIPFILSALFKDIKDKYILITGFLIPILIESYQYILSCGDVDIDDLILNWLGLLIGFTIYKIINKKLLQKT